VAEASGANGKAGRWSVIRHGWV